MAVRSAVQLQGTDMAAVTTALAAVVATPTLANADALIAALNTVAVNGRDSRALETHPAQSFGTDVRALALAAKRDAEHNVKVGLATDANAWRRLQTNLVGDPKSPWLYYANTPVA